LSSEDKNSPRLGRPTTSLVDGVLGDSDGQRDAESQQPVSVPLRGESESILSTYLILISILLMVLSPLAVPVAITVAPWLVSAVRRIRLAFGRRHAAPRFA
jgi:hypothetical protein